MKELVSNNIASIEAQVAEESQKVMTRAEIQDMYGSELEGNPSVYCGTYGKYNNGSLFGLWLDITKFNDYDELDLLYIKKKLLYFATSNSDPDVFTASFSSKMITWISGHSIPATR